eukprot:13796299-Alexandrium_andersonii.AAC.1
MPCAVTPWHAMLCIAARCRIMPRNAVQCHDVQCSTMQCRAAFFRSALCCDVPFTIIHSALRAI